MDSGRTVVGPRAGTRWLLAGYTGVVGFLVLESTVRRPGPASDLHAAADEAGSTRRLATTFLLAAL